MSPDPWNYKLGLILFLSVCALVAPLFLYVWSMRLLIRPLRWPDEVVRRSKLTREKAALVSFVRVTDTMCRIDVRAGKLNIDTFRERESYRHRLSAIVPLSASLQATFEALSDVPFLLDPSKPERSCLDYTALGVSDDDLRIEFIRRGNPTWAVAPDVREPSSDALR
jgi:hypothetical protein